MSGIVVIALEVEEYAKFLPLAVENNIPHYELPEFFAVEEFTTLEEVEAWWLDK